MAKGRDRLKNTPDRPDELRIPEVVKPRKPQHLKKTMACGDRPPKPPSASQAQQQPQKRDTEQPARAKRTAPPPPPKPVAPPPDKKKRGGGKLIAAAIGLLMLLTWYAANTGSTSQSEALSKSSAAPVRKPEPPPISKPRKQIERTKPEIVTRQRYSPQKVTPQSGALDVSATVYTSDDHRYRVTGPVAMRITNQSTGWRTATNATLPFRWTNLASGQYTVAAKVAGYRLRIPVTATVNPSITANLSLQLDPLPSRVRFVVTPPDVEPDIYRDGQYIGKAPGPIELEPFVNHILLFKASGWRSHQQKVRLTKPNKTFRTSVTMRKAESRLRVSVRDLGQKGGRSGTLIIGNGKPFRVSLPYEGTKLPLDGTIKVYLRLDGESGYDVRKALMVPGHITSVVFPDSTRKRRRR